MLETSPTEASLSSIDLIKQLSKRLEQPVNHEANGALVQGIVARMNEELQAQGITNLKLQIFISTEKYYDSLGIALVGANDRGVEVVTYKFATPAATRPSDDAELIFGQLTPDQVKSDILAGLQKIKA